MFYLAGSERLKRTGATGDRAKEGISINCGLLGEPLFKTCISYIYWSVHECKSGPNSTTKRVITTIKIIHLTPMNSIG